MDNCDDNRAKQRKLSSNNNRYNINEFTNQACHSNNEILYAPTESNWNMKRKRLLSGISYQKNNQNKFGFPQVYTSGCSHNTANLYLNKKNFSFKKKPITSKNNYYDKEKLYQNMMKLQTSLNILNQKYQKQKMENDKQAREIERQNKFLNYLNDKNLKKMELYAKNNIYGNEYYDNREYDEMKEDENTANKKEREDLIKNLTKSNEYEYESKRFVKLNEEKYNLNSLNNKKITFNALKALYNELYNEYKERDKLLTKNEKEKEKYAKENDMLKVANETLISNLKKQMKRLEVENDKKELQIKELKKNIKCSRYTELLKENEVLNFEMEKLKNKLNDALKLINDYKKQEEEIKKLYEVIKKKDFKIKALELELITLSNNSDETTKKLQDEIIIKDKLLKKQERDMKRNAFEKYALMQGQNLEDINKNNATTLTENKYISKSLDINTNDIIAKMPELYQLYIEMKHKEIKTSKNFINEILKKISDVININDAKIIYIDLLLKYFNIDNLDIESKNIIVNLADKEFTNNRSINEIKNKHIKIFDKLFNKNVDYKMNLEIIKKYIDKNNLEEFINRTLMELDKQKLGYITFKEMKNVIIEAGLNDFQEDILLLTKSEIFNRCNYYNLLVLFNSNNNIDINNYAQVNNNKINNNSNNDNNNDNDNDNNDENNGIHDINNANNNDDQHTNENNEIKNDSKNNLVNDNNNQNNENNVDIVDNNNKNENENDENNNVENNNNENNNIENNNIDNNNENNENNNNEVKDENNNNKEKNENENPTENELEKKLKKFVHIIKNEGASPHNYISHLKEPIVINNSPIDAINILKLKEFLESKKIELKEDEINILQNIYKIKEINEEKQNDYKDFINYDAFSQKLLNIIQNLTDNDEDFFKNIPVMEIGGME